jgi:tetratricopeptide (TPR) repeat protein
MYAQQSIGYIYLRKGESAHAIPPLERAWKLSQAKNFDSRSAGLLGYAYALAGRDMEALYLLEAAREQDTLSIYLTWIGEAYLLLGRVDKARDLTQQALTYNRIHKRHGYEACDRFRPTAAELRQLGMAPSRQDVVR